jgi:hypothetical protein
LNDRNNNNKFPISLRPQQRFNSQSMGDTVDVLEALFFYCVLTGAMYIFSWFGNELSTQVREFITFSTRYNYFVIVLKIQSDSIARSPKLLSIKIMLLI